MSTNSNISENTDWAYFTRFLSILFVICIHVTSPVVSKFGNIDQSHWWYGNLYNSVSRVGVPLFFMLSGFLLLGKNEPIYTFFSKRFSKVFIPLVVWSLIYIVWKVSILNMGTYSFHSFYSILYSPAHYHLWFMYSILGIYLYLPLLRILIANAPTTYLWYFVILWIFSVSIFPYLHILFDVYSHIELKMVSGFTGYLVVGYLLGNIKYRKIHFLVSSLILILSNLLTAYATLKYSVMSNQMSQLFYNYLAPNVILQSISIFICLKYVFNNTKLLRNSYSLHLFKLASSCTLGIYMIHIMCIVWLSNGTFGFRINALTFHPIYSIPLVVLLTFSLSLIITFFIKKIPFIKTISP